MKNFSSTLNSINALGATEMKNVKGGAGNCGFLFVNGDGTLSRTVCGLLPTEEETYINQFKGTWCCGKCSAIGC